MKTLISLRQPRLRRLAVGALLCVSLTAGAQSYFLQPGPAGTQDTWTFDLEDFTHGKWGVLQANQAEANQRLFVAFPNLSGITAPVQSAYLGLYRMDAGTEDSITLELHAVMASWNQDLLTWSSMPLINPAVEASATMGGTNGVWIEWNITALVNDWLTGTRSNFGVAIYDHGSGVYQRFVSSDNATASQPDTYAFPRNPALQPYLRGDLVPEPSSFAVFALGLAAMACRPRRPHAERH